MSVDRMCQREREIWRARIRCISNRGSRQLNWMVVEGGGIVGGWSSGSGCEPVYKACEKTLKLSVLGRRTNPCTASCHSAGTFVRLQPAESPRTRPSTAQNGLLCHVYASTEPSSIAAYSRWHLSSHIDTSFPFCHSFLVFCLAWSPPRSR